MLARKLSRSVGIVTASALLVFTLGTSATAAEPSPAPDADGWGVDVTAPEDQIVPTAEDEIKIAAALRAYIAAPNQAKAEVMAAQKELASLGDSVLRQSQAVAATSAPSSAYLGMAHVGQS